MGPSVRTGINDGADRLAAARKNVDDDPFAAIIAATHTAVAITNPRLPDNPVIYVNDSFCRLTGYSRDEIVGRNCRCLQGAKTAPDVVAAIRAAVAADRPIAIDLLNYRKDGTTFWNRLAIAPVFNAAGAVIFFSASQIDVSDERAREQALANDNADLELALADRLAEQRDSEARLRFATEAAAIGVWEIDLTTMTLTATPTLAAIYGFRGDVVPSVATIRAATHPDDVAASLLAFDRITSGEHGDNYSNSYRILAADTPLIWIEARGQLVRDAAGRPVRLIGVTQDVTARREVAARLELSEQSLRLAADAAEIGTWDFDLTSDTLTWSDRTRVMFGISPGLPVGMPDFYTGLHPDDIDATTVAFAAALDPALRAAYDVEYRTIGKEDGVVRWIAAKGKVLFDGDRCIRAIGSVIDITRRRRAAARQEFLLAFNDEVRSLGDAKEILRTTALRLGATLGVSRVGYGTVQDDDGTIVIDTPFANGVAPASGTYPLDAFGREALERSRRGETGVVAGIDPGRTGTGAVAAGIRAWVSVPLVRDGQFRATIFVQRTDPAPWDLDDVALIEAVAVRTWEAIQRARAEAERHVSDARLRAVIEAAPIGLIFAANDGRILGGNAQVERLFGHPVLPSPSVAAYTDYVAFHADGRQVSGDEYPLARALAGEERPELETLYRRGDGSLAWLHFVAAPIRDADGAVTGGVVASIDIDRERRAELALRDLNTVLEQRVAATAAERDAIWRESGDLLLIISPLGIIEAVNPAWTVTLGYAEDTLVGHHFAEFLVEDDVKASNEVLPTVTSVPLRGFENRYRHVDGSIRDLAWTATEANGKLYCVARDMTDEKVAARALDVAQEALRQAQKMEAVGQLTGGIAHDFNNMLSVVLGSLDLLGRRLAADDTRARRYVDAATDGARRAATLTQRLLAFSRQQPLQPEPTDVNRLVAGMSSLLRGSLGGAVQLETVLAGGLWPICADPNQLENVILNLGINARDAMPDGGRVTIETANAHLDDRYVAAEIGVAAGQYVLIAVSDAGTGMPVDVVAKAFDPFFTTKPVGKGTGLGLSQVYGFAKQSGGHVKIYSEVGVGTTVKLYLPRLTGMLSVISPSEPADAGTAGDGCELILVVEDDPGVRAVSVEALRELGYRVVEADGAAAALEQIAAHPDIDLMFTDIVMPEVNGAKLAEAARLLRPGLKVLFTTGYTRNAVVHNGVVDAGVELIGKPFTIDALAAKVRSVLDA